MTQKLYRVWTAVDGFDFGDQVLRDFTVAWVAAKRSRPPRPHAEAIEGWPLEADAEADQWQVVAALDQLFYESQANALEVFLRRNNDWESVLEEVGLPLPRSYRPIRGGTRKIELPPNAIRFLPDQAVEIVGLVFEGQDREMIRSQVREVVEGGVPKESPGLGLHLDLAVPVGAPEEKPVPAASGTVEVGPRGSGCEACGAPIGSPPSQKQVLQGHYLCLACVNADQEAALAIARARHGAYLRRMKAELERTD
ncbi:hypothetical protein ACFL59_11655 [Planctomycetota bacterium]